MRLQHFELLGKKLTLYIPETDEEKAVGLLSWSTPPNEDTGMWFQSSPWPRLHTMNMRFPIDIVWLDENLDFVFANIMVQPDQMVAPQGPIAIELAGGWWLRNAGP